MTSPWPTTPPTAAHKAAYADAKPVPYWLDALPPREPYPTLSSHTNADLCIVGGGFTGLWAALRAKHENPWRDVALLEQDTIGIGASCRNGGFVISSLTHGIANGLTRFEDEMPELERLAQENFDGLKEDLQTYGIDCDFEETGDLLALLEPYQDGWIEEEAESAQAVRARGRDLRREPACGGSSTRRSIAAGSGTRRAPGYSTPASSPTACGETAIGCGVRIYEHTRVTRPEPTAARRSGSTTPQGTRQRQARPPCHQRLPRPAQEMNRYIAPVYDYALMTEPLTQAQQQDIGWHNRQGTGDSANQFHYYRLTSRQPHPLGRLRRRLPLRRPGEARSWTTTSRASPC